MRNLLGVLRVLLILVLLSNRQAATTLIMLLDGSPLRQKPGRILAYWRGQPDPYVFRKTGYVWWAGLY